MTFHEGLAGKLSSALGRKRKAHAHIKSRERGCEGGHVGAQPRQPFRQGPFLAPALWQEPGSTLPLPSDLGEDSWTGQGSSTPVVCSPQVLENVFCWLGKGWGVGGAGSVTVAECPDLGAALLHSPQWDREEGGEKSAFAGALGGWEKKGLKGHHRRVSGETPVDQSTRPLFPISKCATYNKAL